MKEDILSLLLQTEEEYDSAVKDAVAEAEKYVDSRRKEQAEYTEEMRQELSAYERAESEKLELALAAESAKMESKAVILKQHMKARQMEKADWISELLKEEVLSLLWR